MRILLFVCVCISEVCAFGAALAKPEPPPVKRTKAEVDAIIDKAGATPPDWWASEKLNVPAGLDLTWAKPVPKEPWTPSKYLGQHIWSVVNENPSRWKYGAKLLTHTLDVNKADPDKLKTSMRSLASIYHSLLQDYPRSAFWYKKAGSDGEDINLADCYWKLGCKDAAVEILKKDGEDDTRHGAIIKLWADMGEYDTAVKLAENKAKEGMADVAWLMAGDACRLAGKSKEAADYYSKVLTVADANGGRDIKQSKERAKASLDAVKLFDLLDLKKVADGTYSSSSYGYSGQVNVNVIVKAGRIDAVNIGAHQEKQYYGSLTETPRRIIAKQSVKGIDTFSSATITSEAIINATAKALSSGMK